MDGQTTNIETNFNSSLAETSSKKREAPDKRAVLGVILMALTGVGYGIQAPLIKLAYNNGATSSTMLVLRFSIAALAVWILLLGRRTPMHLPTRKKALSLLLGALFITNSLFFYLALTFMEVGTATLLVYCFPALVVLWSTLIFKEPLSRGRLLALLLSLLGCALTVDPWAILGTAVGFSWVGALLSFGSAFSNSWYTTLAGHFGRGVPGMVSAGYGLPVTAVGFWIWGLIGGGLKFDMSLAAWAFCLTIGLLTIFCVVAGLIGLSLAGSSRGAVAITTEPAVVVLLGILLLGEEMSLIKLAGGVLILTAVVILSRPRPASK